MSLPVVPCAHCRQPIPAANFVYWSRTKQMLSAECPACTRRTTLATASWRLFNEQPPEVSP